MRDCILRELARQDALGVQEGLMERDLAARCEASIDDVKSALLVLAREGKVHRSSFWWYLGPDESLHLADQIDQS